MHHADAGDPVAGARIEAEVILERILKKIA